MRPALIGFGALAAFMATAAEPSGAAPRPWCVANARQDSLECLYYTFEQCYESAKGVGSCMENPALLWERYRPGSTKPAAPKFRPRRE